MAWNYYWHTFNLVGITNGANTNRRFIGALVILIGNYWRFIKSPGDITQSNFGGWTFCPAGYK